MTATNYYSPGCRYSQTGEYRLCTCCPPYTYSSNLPTARSILRDAIAQLKESRLAPLNRLFGATWRFRIQLQDEAPWQLPHSPPCPIVARHYPRRLRADRRVVFARFHSPRTRR